MRTAITLLVITSLLLCGFIAAAQEEAAPGAPTALAVEAALGQETVEGAPGAPTDSSAEAAPGAETGRKQYKEGDRLPDGTLVGTPEDEKPVMRGDLDQGDGDNVDQNPPNPPAQPQVVERVIERRTQVVREIAAASQRGDQAAVKRLTTELGKLNERIAAVEANPLGGEEGQRRLWQDVLLPAGIRSESYLREHYGLEPVSAPENAVTTPAPVPAAPQGQGGRKMTGTEWLLLALIIAAAATAIAIALRGTRMDILVATLGEAADRLQGGESMDFSATPSRVRLRVQPANPTPVIPPAPAAAPAQPAFPAAPLGTAFVPVQVTANPVVLNPVQPAPAAPAQPAPAPAPVQPAPQPVQVWFNNNMGGQPAAQPQRNPQNQPPAQPAPQQRQPQAPQAQQPRQPRNQPRNQGPANPPAAGQGAPPAQGGGQGGNAPANP